MKDLAMSNWAMSLNTQRVCRPRAVFAAVAGAALLTGCVSFGEDPPEQLLTLTSSYGVPAGSDTAGAVANALAVQTPATPQRLNVTRIPVWTGDNSVAYLKDAVWVQKPAQLFQTVLIETIRGRGSRLVVSDSELAYAAPTQLTGELMTMDYDAQARGVLVRFDAVLVEQDGTLRSRRFEAEVDNVEPVPLDVGRALNRAANQVAGEVAEWVN